MKIELKEIYKILDEELYKIRKNCYEDITETGISFAIYSIKAKLLRLEHVYFLEKIEQERQEEFIQYYEKNEV